MEKEKTFSYKIGKFVGTALVGLFGVGVVGAVAALVIKLLSVLITWLFF